jgi:hypothetical protein
MIKVYCTWQSACFIPQVVIESHFDVSTVEYIWMFVQCLDIYHYKSAAQLPGKIAGIFNLHRATVVQNIYLCVCVVREGVTEKQQDRG